jgi:hypothetical protein
MKTEMISLVFMARAPLRRQGAGKYVARTQPSNPEEKRRRAVPGRQQCEKVRQRQPASK